MVAIHERFRHAAETWPDAKLVYWNGGQQSAVRVIDIYRTAARVAGWLQTFGIAAGDRIVLQLPYSRENIVATLAALRLGAVVVPVPQIYGARELEYVIAHAGAKLLFTLPAWRNADLVARSEGLVETHGLRHAVIVGHEGSTTHTTPWSLLEAFPSESAIWPSAPDELAAMLYTSGTTAKPKAVQHTHQTLCRLMDGLIANLAGPEPQNFFACFPPGHIGGLITMLRPAFDASNNIYMDKWDGEAALELIHQHQVRLSFGGPFFLSSLLDAAKSKGIGPLRAYVCGGANVPPSLIRAAAAAGLAASRSFGSTEHPMLTYSLPGDPLDKRAGTDGRCLPGSSLRIIDDLDEEVAYGQIGEIVTKGETRFIGYSDDEANVQSFTADGWFRTGDIGRLDAEGYLQVVDRKKDIIIRGGENISSMEVEQLLCLHPAISEAAVVGVPDTVLGERVCAFVTLREGLAVDVPELIRHFDALGVARQKTPERLVAVGGFPRNAAGKILKADLRAQARA